MFIKEIILLFVVTLLGLCAGDECKEKGMRQYDQNVAKLLTIGNSGRKFPTSTGAPLKKWCSGSESYIKEMEKFKTTCMKDLSKQVSAIFIHGLKNNLIKGYCKKDTKRMSEFAAAGDCLNRNGQIITKCYSDMIDSILGAQNAPDNLKIPHFCCAYNKIFECFNEKLTKAPGCNEQHADTLGGLVKGFASNAVDLLCGEYNEASDKCTSLGAPPKKSKDAQRWKSFAPPVLDLLSSFPAV